MWAVGLVIGLGAGLLGSWAYEKYLRRNHEIESRLDWNQRVINTCETRINRLCSLAENAARTQEDEEAWKQKQYWSSLAEELADLRHWR